MFNKALFKQSCKANGTMWGIITLAVCFMLSSVMLISGNGNIGEVKNAIQDTIITKEVDAQLQKRALSYYGTAADGLEKFDVLFTANAKDTVAYLTWCAAMPQRDSFANDAEYAAAMSLWQGNMPEMKTDAGTVYAGKVALWKETMPKAEHFASTAEYMAALAKWQEKSPANQETAVTIAYAMACEELQAGIRQSAAEAGYAEEADETLEMLGSVMVPLNPNGLFSSYYTENGDEVPADYDIMSLLAHIGTGDEAAYIASAERVAYRQKRAEEGSAVLLAANMTKAESVEKLTDALSSYGVTKEKYDSFGYTYASVKHMARTAIVTYQGRLEYEKEQITKAYADGAYADESAYRAALTAKAEELAKEISSSFLSTLPSSVSDALEEIGKADLYTLIVGSIFYKLAGLLLPIIYMIMASNNLIAGQVDSGSMAYVLSTSTKRSSVVFTQSVYLIGSLLAMFGLTTATGCVCLAIVGDEVALTYGKLALLNVGAFLVLFALSGLCFFTSCLFDRSKRSMAIGGGLSIFALVAAMLGLFGSPVIPSVVRLDALNYFNYTTIISLFDVISIIDGTNVFLWKFAILAVLGFTGYILGAMRFTKKDLPL